jgi:hypothetical protein
VKVWPDPQAVCSVEHMTDSDRAAYVRFSETNTFAAGFDLAAALVGGLTLLGRA